VKKRLLSAALCLSLLTGLLPMVGLAAEDIPSACLPGCSLEKGHGGECVLHETRYKTEAEGEWVYGTLTDACANVYEGGRVEVLRDIDPSSPVTVCKPLTLASADPENPCRIVYTSDDQHDPFSLTIRSEATLENIILDGGREEGRTSHTELVGVYSGTLTLESGAVLQNNNNVDTAEGAGALRVVGGKAIMRPGSAIRNCQAVAGGGAAVANKAATLEMRGGVIEDCVALLGGGIYIKGNGAVLLTGGTLIRRCRAKETLEGIASSAVSFQGCGGGVFVTGGTVVLQNAVLEENTAELVGGGMYVYYGLAQLMGGQVSKNHAGGCGGGLGMSPVASVMVGFEPRVIGNTSGEGRVDNVCLEASLDEDGSDPTRPLFIGADMGENAYVGVTRLVPPDETVSFRVVAAPNSSHTITDQDLGAFYSDDPRYVTLRHDKYIVITKADVVFDNQGHGQRPPSQQVPEDHTVEEPERLEEKGYEFEGWYREPECTTAWNFADDKITTDDRPQVLYAKWYLLQYEIVYDLEGGEPADNPGRYNVESPDITLKEPTKEGYAFDHWELVAVDDEAILDRTPAARSARSAGPDIPAGSTGKRTFKAIWRELPKHTVTYTDGAGGAAFADQVIGDIHEGAATPGFSGTPARPGYTFTGWLPEVAETVTDDVVYVAQWKKKTTPPSGGDKDPPPSKNDGDPPPSPPVTPPALESREHFAYIVGYPDGTVRPEACITRSEVVSIFFRLMTDDFRAENWTAEDPFPDVSPDAWYHNAVSTSVRAGLIRGFPDGTFGGTKRITRGEFAAIAARFLSEDAAPDSGFPDLAGHWAKEEVDRAVAAGWIKGFPDGKFHPDDYITRSEVMTLINRMLNRLPDPEGMREDMHRWPDCPESAWYYADVQEATNGHTYEREEAGGAETWTGLTADRDWTELER